MIYEIIGYVASGLVAISLTMRSILRLRIINLLGAITFTIYGLLIGAFPVTLVNFIIILINLYYLRAMFTATEYFQLLEVKPDSVFLRSFLNHYADDFQDYYPNMDVDNLDFDIAYIALRDMVPAGAFIAKELQNGECKIILDYVTPVYRDFKIGRYIYDENKRLFIERGIHTIYAPLTTDTPYLQKMGFVDEQRADNRLVKRLKIESETP